METMETNWDLVDPNPDLHALFIEFSRIYFEGNLGCVLVEWSKRMTSCAGMCYFTRSTGHCIIRISEPLLKFRPRQDLIDTLLHEMIHAFLFISNNNTDRDDHGQQFQHHMRRINAAAGASITIYHNFGEEVDFYKVHTWFCNGPCQARPPFFGLLRRATNRAPGPNDRWWVLHNSMCGGQFIKVSGPKTSVGVKARRKSSKKKNEEPDALPVDAAGTKENLETNQNKGDIRNFFTVLNQQPCRLEPANSGKNKTGRAFTFSDFHDSKFDTPSTAAGTTAGASGISVWPGTGIRLGSRANTPGGPSSTITSGSLLAMERENIGPDEASCAKHDISLDAASLNNNGQTIFGNKLGDFPIFQSENCQKSKTSFEAGNGIYGGLNDFSASTFHTDPVTDFDLTRDLDKSTTSELERINQEINSLKTELEFHIPEKDQAVLQERNSKVVPQPPIGTMPTGHGPNLKPVETVECPMCLIQVPLRTINEHIDNNCYVDELELASSVSAMTRCAICQVEIPHADLEDHKKLCLQTAFDEVPVGLPLSSAWENYRSMERIRGSGAIASSFKGGAISEPWRETGSMAEIWGGGAIGGPSDRAAIASLSDGAAVAGPSDGAATSGPSSRLAIVRPRVLGASTGWSGGGIIAGPSGIRILSNGEIAGPSRKRVVSGLIRVEAVAGPSRKRVDSGPIRDEAVAGPSGIRILSHGAIAGLSRKRVDPGPIRDEAIAGPSGIRILSDVAIAGPSRKRVDSGPIRDEAVAGPSGIRILSDVAIAGPSGLGGRGGAYSLFQDEESPANNGQNTVECPVCNAMVLESIINSHLDDCIDFDGS